MKDTIEIINALENYELVCYVPVKHFKVKILRKDFEELWELGATLPWNIAHGRVHVRGFERNNHDVARLLMDAREREYIAFLDDNPLNLLRDNLIRKPGGSSKGAARDYIAPRYRASQPTIKHIKLKQVEGIITKEL